MSIDLRDRVRLVMINKTLDEFMVELKRNYHNATILNIEVAYDGPKKEFWQWLAGRSAELISDIKSQIDCEDIYHYGRSGATIATDCYWAMRTWERDDVAAEFDLPLTEKDMEDYNCLDYEDALDMIKKQLLYIKTINDLVINAVASLAKKKVCNG